MTHPVPSWKHAPTAARRGGPLSGTVRVPGDKSISHRALMLGALAIGRTEISGLLEGDDVLATAAALNALGASVIRSEDDRWTVDGIGVGALAEPEDLLDLGDCRLRSEARSIRSRLSIVCRCPRPRSNPRCCWPG